MPDDDMQPPAYGDQRYVLTLPDASVAVLDRMTQRDAGLLGAAFASMEPWSGYRISAEVLASFLGKVEQGGMRFAIRLDGALVGAVVIREPWLLGPYLQFLGLLSGRQGMGLGKVVLDWMATAAPAGTRNLWLCVTASNVRARAFYEREGFVHAARLSDLVADGTDELLMRRRLHS